MWMSQTAEYALRAMAYLATLQPTNLVSATQLAEASSIPVPYLHKVMRRLVIAGLVTSRRGHGGGFALGRPVAEIRLADVLTAAGADDDDHHCAFGWGACNATQPCPLHHACSDLRARYDGWAHETTLADAVARYAQRRQT